MNKRRAILSSGQWAVQQKRGPIRSADTGAAAIQLAKADLTKLEAHYGTTGMVISDSQTLLWNGETDSIFDGEK